MNKSARVILAALAASGVLTITSDLVHAETYTVGTNERYRTISEVAEKLDPGDVVEIRDDIVDKLKLTKDGTSSDPIIIKGIARLEGGRMVRPKLIPRDDGVVISCLANWNVIEGLDLSGIPGLVTEGMRHAGDNLTIRNCFFAGHAKKAIAGTAGGGSILIEFCEFESNGSRTRNHTVDLWSGRRGSVAVVQHCYFHDGTGGHLLKSHCWRNIVRYNWFENPYYSAVQIVDEPMSPITTGGDTPYPMHSDIVGNVFLQGWSPGSQYSLLQLGGEHETAAGTEGDFNIAHNLFALSRGGVVRGVALLVHGNVDHVRLYNNVCFEFGNRGGLFYERGTEWPDVPKTKSFVAQRGHSAPIIEGANNWVSDKSDGIPRGCVGTLRGRDPGFMDVWAYDFRPCVGSPLADAALPDLPLGSVDALKPLCEPQRGVPADLKAIPRKASGTPAIGPFEKSAADAPKDDTSDMLFPIDDPGLQFPWPIAYAEYVRSARILLSKREYDKALQTAKSAFIFCPTDDHSLQSCAALVMAALEGIDGNHTRSADFQRRALGARGKAQRQDETDSSRDFFKTVSPALLDGAQRELGRRLRSLERRATVEDAVTDPHRFTDLAWYETASAIALLEAGRFDVAAERLVEVLAGAGKRAYGDVDGEQGLQRNSEVIERVKAGLSVVYRARTGTVKGWDLFFAQCLEYVKHGPAGADGTMGTEDDLKAPL